MRSGPSTTLSRSSHYDDLMSAGEHARSGLKVAPFAFTASLPFLIGAARLIAQKPVIYFDGDPAVDELALVNATHFSQLVGNYSRYGWSHPGPAWFYALSGFYQVLGSQSWAFIVANMIINAIAVGLIVFVVMRVRGAYAAVGTAALMLAYFALIGLEPFRDVWPPYAVILPMLLVVVLSIAFGAGWNAALVWSAVAGSFAVQLHVGTAPTVAGVIVTGVAVRVAGAVWDRRDRPRLHDFLHPGSLIAAGLLVLMWIPPLVDEVRNRPGNLTALFTFFTSAYPKHRWLEGVSILGRILSPWQWPTVGSLQAPDITGVSVLYGTLAIAYIALCAALFAVGRRARDRFGESVGAVLFVGALVAIISIRDVAGPVYSYLLLWMTPMPALLVLGWLSVLARSGRWSLEGARWRNAMEAAAPGLAVVLGFVVTILVLSVPRIPVAAPDTPQAWTITEGALNSAPQGPVVIDIGDRDAWVVAAGVADQLVKHGRLIRVEKDWTFMFGGGALASGDESVKLTFVDAANDALYASAHPEANLVGATYAHGIFMTIRS